jgi:hypothetical protein
MRSSTIFFASILAAATFTGCQKSNPAGDDDAAPDAAGSGSDLGVAFEAQSTDTIIAAGQEVTYCYYFHTSNTVPVAINKWVSDMTPGSHHMIFFTGGAAHADGLDTTNSCGIGGSGGSLTDIAQWVFASQSEHLEEDLPADDGNGLPLAQVIQPNTLGSFQMHYLNSTDAPITVHVKLSAYALPATVTAYTRTDAYITYNQDISIPAGSTGTDATGSCKAPAGAKFWTMSTHSHKQSVETTVMDSTAMVVDSTDWEHPTVQTWATSPFFTYASNKVTWNCHYKNDGETAPPDNSGSVIHSGNSAQTDEMCMATGYFFPSTGAQICVQYGGQCGCLNN